MRSCWIAHQLCFFHQLRAPKSPEKISTGYGIDLHWISLRVSLVHSKEHKNRNHLYNIYSPTHLAPFHAEFPMIGIRA